MPVVNTLDWSTASANGTYSVGSGDHAVNVAINTTTASNGNTASVATEGQPQAEGLWVNLVEQSIATSIGFDAPIANAQFELFDVDQGQQWDDRVTVLAYDENNNPVEVQFSNLDHHSVSGNTVEGGGAGERGVWTYGADDSVSVTIPGPLSRIEIIFDNGSEVSTSGQIGLSDIQFSPPPDGIVEGDGTDNLINFDYVDDPEGDRVTDADTTVHAGGGNDTINTGEGNDSILGGAGNDSVNSDNGNDTIDGGAGHDTIYAGEGDDLIIGGTGNDTANGHTGNDTLDGGLGDDYIRGSWGNDTLYTGSTGEGNDSIWGGWGDDRFIFENGFGNDTIDGDTEAEVAGDTIDLTQVTDNLTIDLSSNAPGVGTISDGTSTATFTHIEHIELGSGTDTIRLADGSGTDRVTGFTAPTDNGNGTYTAGDMLVVTAVTNDGGTTAITTNDVTVSSDADSNAVLTFPDGATLTLVGVSASAVSSPAALAAMGIPMGSDGIVQGTAGNDLIDTTYVDSDADRVDNDDAILSGYTGDDDLIRAGAGNDTVNAGDGNDVVEGEAGNDSLYGGLGNDSLSGGAGHDTLVGSAGNDTLDGGADRDVFHSVTSGDVVRGGETGDDYDTLDLTGAGPLSITYDNGTTEDGRVDFLDNNGQVTGSITFTGIEKIVPCFTPGTMIATVEGMRPVEELEAGDAIFTRDHGVQEIQWVGHKNVSSRAQKEAPYLSPILIKAGALGQGLPERDMRLSPNHRVLVTAPDLELMFGEGEVLVAAKHLKGLKGITQCEPEMTTYIHLMFDRHEIIWSDGVWSESFQPGAMAIAGLENAQRDEIFSLFPELATEKSKAYHAARRVLKKHEVALIPLGRR